MTKFAASDHHFFHDKLTTFTPEFGTSRPFASVKEMNEALVDNHNAIVTKDDTTFFGGDVVFNTSDSTIHDMLRSTVGRMNGKKIVILGNHESRTKTRVYAEFFDGIIGYLEQGHDFIYSHIPVHASQVGPNNRFKYNVHGHVHSATLDDPLYFNVSMEAIDYKPIAFSDIRQQMRNRGVI